MKILITGSNGLLGQKLVKRCIKHNIPFIATSKGGNRNPDCPETAYRSMDITNKSDIISVVNSEEPTAIIHTAAHTNVDFCELNREECHEVNVHATELLWDISKEKSIHFQLLSTDFVFDGLKGNYTETDPVNPLSVYAQSKVDAEKLLLSDENTNWSIARTIIVYGTGHGLSRSNMIVWALEALPKGDEMKLVNDQFRAPTWADDLAYGCVEIIKRNEKGIFHLCGPVTRAIDETVEEIAKILEIAAPKITTISSATLSQPAARPPKTGFDLSKARNLLAYSPMDFDKTIPILKEELALA